MEASDLQGVTQVMAVSGFAAFFAWRSRLSVVVLIRTLRPYVTTLGIAIWLVYRLFIGSETSFLDLLITSLERVKRLTSEWNFAVPVFNTMYVLLEDFMVILMARAFYRVLYCLWHYTCTEWKDISIDRIFEWSKEHVPFVKKEINRELGKVRKDMEDFLHKDSSRVTTTRLPTTGRSHKELIQLLSERAKQDHAAWQGGQVSGAVYPTHDDHHMELIEQVYSAYALSNPLHPDVWPSLQQMDAEIVAITANLLSGHDYETMNGENGTTNGHHNGHSNDHHASNGHFNGTSARKASEIVGTTSSCGSESIILAIKAHRQYYGTRRGIAYPELICGSTAHASVDKACELMNIRKVCVPCDEQTHTLVPSEVLKYVTCNTIMIYASAPNYPQGTIDPIEELSEIALKYDIGLHVDACLGGWVLPFARKLGYPIPNFGFEVAGVTSMSSDTHKFAYASKGTSVVLYRNKELRHAQYFSYSKWSGGLYMTPTIPGSRPGGLLACAWATMQHIGESGYLERVESILEASQAIAEGIKKISGIRLLGTQRPTMVVCFTSDEMDIHRISDLMGERGWHLNSLQNPASVHICVTLNTVPVVDNFIEDLGNAVAAAKKEGVPKKKGGTAGVYGMSGPMPAGPVNEILNVLLDMMYTP